MAAGALDLVNRYFDAVGRRDLDALAACRAQDGAEHLAGGDVRAQLEAAADG